MTRWGRSVAPKVRLVVIVLASMAGLLALPSPSPAAADPFGWEPGGPGVPGDTCGSATDVAFTETGLPGPLGRAQCVTAVPNSVRCD